MQLEVEPDLQKLSDRYHQRRTVESGEPYDCEILDLERLNDNQIGLHVNVAQEKWVIHCLKDTNWTSAGSIAEILRESAISKEFTTNLAALVGKTLTVTFDDSMSECKLYEGDGSFSIKRLEETRTESAERTTESVAVDQTDFESLERELTLNRVYENNDREWKCTIDNVIPEAEESFKVVVDTGTEYPLEWLFELPESTNEEASDVARLIEHVGGGELEYLQSGNVYVVNIEDVESKRRGVGFDKTNQWELVTPSDFREWQETAADEKSQTEDEKNTNSTSVSQGRTHARIRKQRAKKMVSTGLVTSGTGLVYKHTIQQILKIPTIGGGTTALDAGATMNALGHGMFLVGMATVLLGGVVYLAAH